MMCQITFLGIAHLHLNKSSKQNSPTTTWLGSLPIELWVLITPDLVHIISRYM
jgi:hypothetical protein